MNKTCRTIIKVITSLVLCYFAYFIYQIVHYKHSVNWSVHKQYRWIFKDSVKNYVDSTFCYSYVYKKDIYNNFIYNGTYNVIVWEFKELAKFDLNQVTFSSNINLDNKKIRSGQTINKDTDQEIIIKFGHTFRNELNIYLDEYSKIEKKIESPNYKGFYGTINKMSFSNEKGEPQIIFDYIEGKESSLLIVYKKQNRFFLILINSKEPLDEKIINILNLS